tara:strand:- start:170 stop:454 length:285 start_codon:yes stop_codon:yes gene_type:complete
MSWKDIIKEEVLTEEEAWKKYKETGEEQIAGCPYCDGTGGGIVKPIPPNQTHWFPGPNGERPDTAPKWRECMNCEGSGKVTVPPRYNPKHEPQR